MCKCARGYGSLREWCVTYEEVIILIQHGRTHKLPHQLRLQPHLVIILRPIFSHGFHMDGRQCVVGDVADGQISVTTLSPGGPDVFDGARAAVVFTPRRACGAWREFRGVGES